MHVRSVRAKNGEASRKTARHTCVFSPRRVQRNGCIVSRGHFSRRNIITAARASYYSTVITFFFLFPTRKPHVANVRGEIWRTRRRGPSDSHTRTHAPKPTRLDANLRAQKRVHPPPVHVGAH